MRCLGALLVLSYLVCLAGASAQPGLETPPAPAPARPLQMPVFAEAELANGLKVVVIERRGLPLVTAMLSVQAGSLDDPVGKSGLAELSLGVLAKGARRGQSAADAAALARAADSLGSGLDISTGLQSSRLVMTVMTGHLSASLALMADVLRSPTLPALEIASGREQMREAIKLAAADPAAVANELAWRLHWGDRPAGRLSTEQTVARIRRADVQAFCRQHLRPEQTRLILAGDLNLAQGRALAERYFGAWRAHHAARPRPQLEQDAGAPTPVKSPAAVLVDLAGSGQSAVVVLAPFVPQPRGQAEPGLLHVGRVASAVLGNGYSSRINQQIRIKRGLSYGAYSNAESLPSGGLLLLSAQTQHQSAAEVADLLREELLRLTTEPVPASEMQARQAALIGELARQLESTQGLANVAAEQLERGDKLAHLDGLADELNRVSAAQVLGLAQDFWPPQAVRIVIVGDLSLSAEHLGRQFPGAWVIPAAELDLSADKLRRPSGGIRSSSNKL